MIRRILGVGAALAALGLGGCSTLNEAECQSAGWDVIGYEDAASGYTADRVGRHRQACADFGITPDLAAYQQGYADGLTVYCRPERGYEAGRANAAYGGQCPAGLAYGFERGYLLGQEIYSLERVIAELDEERYDLQAEIRTIKRDIDRAQADVRDPDLTHDEQSRASDEMMRLLERKERLDRRDGRLFARVYDLEKELSYLTSVIVPEALAGLQAH